MKLEQLHEGPFDFVRGAAKHVGQSIAQGTSNVISAGKKSSQIADLERNVTQLAAAIDSYVETKKAYDAATGTVQPEPSQDQQQQPDPAAQTNQQPPTAQANPMAIKKPKFKLNVDGSKQIQFDSYLKSLDNSDFIAEGVWDFVKGAGSQIVKNIAEPIKQTMNAGKIASLKAEVSASADQVRASIDTLIPLLNQLGDQGQQIFDQLLNKMGSATAAKVQRLVTKAIEKRNVQAQPQPQE